MKSLHLCVLCTFMVILAACGGADNAGDQQSSSNAATTSDVWNAERLQQEFSEEELHQAYITAQAYTYANFLSERERTDYSEMTGDSEAAKEARRKESRSIAKAINERVRTGFKEIGFPQEAQRALFSTALDNKWEKQFKDQIDAKVKELRAQHENNSSEQ